MAIRTRAFDEATPSITAENLNAVRRPHMKWTGLALACALLPLTARAAVERPAILRI